MVTHNETDIKKQFEDLKPTLKEWGAFVDATLQAFLDSLGYSFERIQRKPESRVKDVTSYVQKALYRGKNYTNPIKDITDKVGTRVVLLNFDDVKVVSDFIEKCSEWIVKEKSQDIDYIREHKPSEFGYQSNHYVIAPKEPRYSKELCEILTCEVQVRTLLQHAYAETSHDTVYKSGHAEDPQILRGLAVTMAFLETADEKIKIIYEKAKNVKTKRACLINLAKELYRTFVPSYKDESYDAGMTEAFIAIFDKDYEDQAIAELSEFTKKYETDIIAALTQASLSLLFKQPVIMLAFFGIVKRQTYTIEHWPYSYESLKETIRAMGISEDILYT